MNILPKEFIDDLTDLIENWPKLRKSLDAVQNAILAGKPEEAIIRAETLFKVYPSNAIYALTFALQLDEELWKELIDVIGEDKNDVLAEIRSFKPITTTLMAALNRIKGLESSWTSITTSFYFDLETKRPIIHLRIFEGGKLIFSCRDTANSLAKLAFRILSVCRKAMKEAEKLGFKEEMENDNNGPYI